MMLSVTQHLPKHLICSSLSDIWWETYLHIKKFYRICFFSSAYYDRYNYRCL